MVLEAAKACGCGASREEIIERAFDVKAYDAFWALSTFKYLAMSGRVGKSGGWCGSILSVKPILTIRDGKRYAGKSGYTKQSLARCTNWQKKH